MRDAHDVVVGAEVGRAQSGVFLGSRSASIVMIGIVGARASSIVWPSAGAFDGEIAMPATPWMSQILDDLGFAGFVRAVERRAGVEALVFASRRSRRSSLRSPGRSREEGIVETLHDDRQLLLLLGIGAARRMTSQRRSGEQQYRVSS